MNTEHDAQADNLITLSRLYGLWERLGDVCVNLEGEIDEPFLHFPAGTYPEDIWRWFESQHPRFVVGDVMQGIYAAD